METQLTGHVKMAGDHDFGLRVEISLDTEELRLVTAGGELGRWPLDQIGVNARPDGFHLRVEGEELVLSTSDDAAFAMAIGLRSSASPRLNRQLASAADHVTLHPRSIVDGPLRRPERSKYPPARQSPEVAGSSHPVAFGMVGAAALVLIGGLMGLSSASELELFGLFPAWPVMLITALLIGAGGFSVWSRVAGGRTLVGLGTILGLVALAGSLAGLGGRSFHWIRDGVLPLGAGSGLAGLLLSMDVLQTSHEP